VARGKARRAGQAAPAAADPGGRAWRALAAPAFAERVVDRSRFLADLLPVQTPDQAAAALAEIRKRHHDARHHCSAMILGIDGGQQRSSDDGEPAGTAGVPLLEVLRRRRLTDVVAVVTRYFGGVLLGVGGLVRAYSGAVAAALEEAAFLRLAERSEWTIPLQAATAPKVENALRVWAAGRDAQVSVEYGAGGVIGRIDIAPDQGEELARFAAARGLRPRPGPTRTVRLPS
jgi:uncharacterized YigZ family protein